MSPDLKLENQRRVIHVSDIGSNVLEILNVVQREFWAQRPGHEISNTIQHSATYLFANLSDTQYFGELLDQREVPHSYHPAKDYIRVATQDMDDIGKALF